MKKHLEEIKNKPDAKGQFSADPKATQLRPTFSRPELGAGLGANITNKTKEQILQTKWEDLNPTSK